MNPENQPNTNINNGSQIPNNPSVYPSVSQPPTPYGQPNTPISPLLPNQYTQEATPKKPGLNKIVIGVIVFIIVSIIVGFLLSVMSKPALQTQANNTAITNDADTLAVAIYDYQAETSGVFPVTLSPDSTSGTIDICGKSCSVGAKTTAQLSFYKPASVSIKSYSSSLRVPNINTAYVVNNANCNSSKSGIGPSSSNSYFVVLYATQSGTKPEQKCFQY